MTTLRSALALAALAPLAACAQVLGLDHNGPLGEQDGSVSHDAAPLDAASDARVGEAGSPPGDATLPDGSGPAPDAPNADTLEPFGDGGSPDATVDSATGADTFVPVVDSGSAPLDTGASAPDTGSPVVDSGRPEAGCTTWCGCNGTGAILCEDFDEPNPLNGWTVESDAGAVSISSNQSSSPPSSLQSSIQFDGFGATGYISRALASSPATVTLQFDVYLVPGCGASTVDFVVSRLHVNGSYAAEVLYTSADGGAIEVGGGLQNGTGYASDAPLYVPQASWVTVRMALDTSASTETLTVNGQSAPFTYAFLDETTQPPYVLDVGQYGQTATPCTMYFDNVLVTP